VNNFTNSENNPADMDYNLYYSVVGADNANWIWNGNTYTGFSSYRASTGKDTHSLFADPQFVSLAKPDLRVAASSPAVDAGINLGTLIVGTKDFAGKQRVHGSTIDIGAYEQ
jgi:hypothetical protein